MADRKISEFTEVLSLGDGEFLPAVNPALGSSANANRIIARGNLGFEEAGAAASAVSTHESTYDHSLIATALQPDDVGTAAAEDVGAFDAAGTAAAAVSTHESTYDHATLGWPVDAEIFGFIPGAAETTISFNDGLYEFSLARTGASFTYYRSGIPRTISEDKAVALPGDPTIPATGNYFIYIDADDGTLTASLTPWSLDPNETKVFVAEIEWNNALTPKYLLYDERHLCDISRGEHSYLHRTSGARYKTGGDLTGYVLDSSTGNSDIQFDLAQGQIYDETLLLTQTALTGGTDDYLIRYRNGSGGWNWVESIVPFALAADTDIGIDDGSGTLAQMSPNYFANAWVLMTAAGYQLLQPQNEYATEAGALSEDYGDLALTGLPFPEYVARWRVTLEHKTTYNGTTGRVRITTVTPINVGAIPAATGTAPALHASTHTSGGTDPIQLDDLAAPDDNTDLNATTSAHGLAPKAVAPAAGSLAALGIANGETAYSSKVILEGALKLAVVAALPGTPDSTTLYFVTG